MRRLPDRWLRQEDQIPSPAIEIDDPGQTAGGSHPRGRRARIIPRLIPIKRFEAFPARPGHGRGGQPGWHTQRYVINVPAAPCNPGDPNRQSGRTGSIRTGGDGRGPDWLKRKILWQPTGKRGTSGKSWD